MKILFCNITYMNKYIGITDDDIPNKGGSWVEENKDANEQWNFLNYNGHCYGFVMNYGDQFAIERIEKNNSKSEWIEGVTVVWCALNDNNETVIVGWYENAMVYRHIQNSIVTPILGLYREYFTKANADDCYLLPEESRTFVIGRASKDGRGKGFGRQNYWYAESSYAQNELIPQVLKFLEAHKNERINRISTDFDVPKNVLTPLSETELKKATDYLNERNLYDFLPYGYRLFYTTKTADSAYDIAESLTALHQYKSAISWYKKIVEIEGETWSNTSLFPDLYQQCEMYEKAISSAKEILMYEEAKEINTKHEIYSIIADNYYYLGKIEEGVKWLNKILDESNDDGLKKHTALVKENWMNLV